MNALELNNLTKRYPGFTLDNVSFAIGLFCALAAGMGAMDTPLTGEGAKPAILLPAAAVSLVLYAASWALSVKLYEKRGT